MPYIFLGNHKYQMKNKVGLFGKYEKSITCIHFCLSNNHTLFLFLN